MNLFQKSDFCCKVTPLQARLWPGGGFEVYLYSSKTSTLEGVEWSAARPGRTLPPEKTQYPLYRRLGGHQGWVWTGAENFVPTGIRTPDRPCRIQSLYRLSYPAHDFCCAGDEFISTIKRDVISEVM